MNRKYIKTNNTLAVIAPGIGIFETPISRQPLAAANNTSGGTTIKRKDFKTVFKWYPWGDDNKLPQNIMTKYNQDDIIPSILRQVVTFLIQDGLIYGIKTIEDGDEKFTRIEIPEIEEFLTRSNIESYLYGITADYMKYFNIFPSLILARDRSKIVKIRRQKAQHCRWGLQKENGVIDNCFINANWTDDLTGKNAIEIPALDTYAIGDIIEYIRNDKKTNYEYIYHLETIGDNVYYDSPPHIGLYTSKWLELARQIPEYKAYLMENQIALKYHIKIPTSFWEKLYDDWNTINDTERDERKKTYIDDFITFATKNDNAGTVFITDYIRNPANNEIIDDWIIEPIGDKLKDGAYIEDSQEVSSHIIRAFGLDPTIIGSGPGKNQSSSGSGSDKREAFNINSVTNNPDQVRILQPLNMISRYNNWMFEGRRVYIRFKNYHLQTLNQITQSQR